MSGQPSPESADSIWDSSEQGLLFPGNAKSTSDAETSLPDTSPEPPATRTSRISAFAQNQRDEIREMDVAGALAAEPGMKQQTYLFQESEYGTAGYEDAGTLRAGRIPTHQMLMSSAEDSPAKTCQSQDDEPALVESGQASSSSSHALPMTLFGTEAGSFLRTYPDFFPATTVEISPSFSRRWPSSGFTISPGECWTADTSVCPSGGDASSSLPDVLQGTVPERFFLSPKAAAGILRRAQKRGRALPTPLHTALQVLASQHQDDAKKTT
jgi:hypothetical protein